MTVQIGAVLLFATIIIALATYQATVVPAQNADVEYKHSQQVQSQMTDVRNALLQTAATGNVQPASVTLGTQYSSRVFLLNPPPPAGTLATETYQNGTMRVSNVQATDDETADFFAANGDAWTASTKYLVYQPGYHEYEGAPNVVYGAMMLSNHYPEQDVSVPVTDQLLVRGNTVTLVALNGSLSTSRVGSTSVSATSVSAPYNEVQVTNETAGNVTITVPTKFDAATLRNATNLGEQSTVRAVEPASGGRVRVVLEPGTYTLQTAKLGVGSGVEDEEAQYLTVVDSDDGTVTVEVRDRFNTPVSGVNVRVNGSNPFESGTAVTDDDGRATFEVEDRSRDTATLEILGGDDPHERVTVGTEFGEGGASGGNEAYDVDWAEEKSANQNPGLTCDGENCTLDASVQPSVTLFADSTPVVDGGTFTYSVSSSSVVGVSPESNESDSDGESSTELTAQSSGGANVYVASGGSGDLLSVEVVNAAAVNLPPSVEITDIERAEETGSGKVKSVDVTFTPDDSDGNLDSADVVVYVAGSQSGRTTVDLTGSEGTSQTVRVDTDNTAGEVVAEVTVYDTDGEQGSDRESENDV